MAREGVLRTGDTRRLMNGRPLGPLSTVTPSHGQIPPTPFGIYKMLQRIRGGGQPRLGKPVKPGLGTHGPTLPILTVALATQCLPQPPQG